MSGSPVGGIVLAAGRATRFGSQKLLAQLDGRPLVAHVVGAARAAGLAPLVVVTGPDGALEPVDLGAVRRIINHNPDEGLSSSVRLGLAALDDETVAGAVILLGDQPRVRPDVIRTLVDALADPAGPPLVAPAYADDDAPNPVAARRDAWRLADDLVGDRGFGRFLAERPYLVRRIAFAGRNPDIDTPEDLATLIGER